MKKLLVILVTSLILFSCTEDFITKQPLGVESNISFYQNIDNCELAVNAIYDPLGWEQDGNSYYQIGMLMLGDMRSDDTEKGGGNDVLQYPDDQPAFHDICTFTATPLNGYAKSLWSFIYIGISRANAMLDGSKGFSEDDSEYSKYVRLCAEARFLRAMYYFDLVRIWGPVPLLKNAISPADAVNIGNRADGDDAQGTKQMLAIYEFIISELEAIQNDLPWIYGSEDLGRVTAAAAKSLLAKAYLYKADIFGNLDNEYEKSYLAAKEVIENGTYGLEEKYQDAFDVNMEYEYSKEYIFAVQFVSGGTTQRGGEGSLRPVYLLPRFFVDKDGVHKKSDPEYGYGFNMPRQDLVDAFNPNDPRLDMIVSVGDSLYCTPFNTANPAWWRIGKVDINTGHYCLKGTVNYSILKQYGQTVGKNIPVIRFAEVLLIAAEAGFKDGDYKAQALSYVNELRLRARNSNRIMNDYNDYTYIPGTVPADLKAITLNDIKNERRLELYGEGHRFFDIIRWGDADQIMSSITSDIAGYPVLWNSEQLGRLPIPQSEISLHSGGNLKQNPGY